MYAQENCVTKSEAAELKSHIVIVYQRSACGFCRDVKQQNDKTVLYKLRICTLERNYIFNVAVTSIKTF